ncbi:S8 family serine peptidase [Novosphingobium sp. NPDC080210]|uniref:S8 family serine peptidase n=1 Tax=Novosphingobium sp. NPDC080210 TaxID=3390596 RepID=UPI003CFE7B1D
MKLKRSALFALILAVGAVPAPAQLGLPPVVGTVDETLQTVDRTIGAVAPTLHNISASARSLADARVERLARLLRRNPDSMERDSAGDLARKDELLLLDPDADALEKARIAGFTVLSTEVLAELGMRVVRFRIPSSMKLARAQDRLAGLLPGVTISADTLNFQGGAVSPAARPGKASPASMPPIETPVGIIDGGAGRSATVAETRGFARGAPMVSDHGAAVASLLAHAGVRRVLVADVYGNDPAGGNSLAIARALDWLIGRDIRVVSMSLVGPANPVLARAITAAQRRGAVIVAPVGNDGPAAPAAYPASYPGVIAVTGVDGRNRAMIEAGCALHLDYAAPGADMLGANAAGRWVRVRGTSFAVPFVASRAALVLGGPVAARLDREAIDLGKRGPDEIYGRGLLCVICRRTR